MRKHFPRQHEGTPIEWTPVDRLADLPEGAPAVAANEVALWTLDDDRGGMRLACRQGDELVPLQSDETDEHHEQRVSELMEKDRALSQRRRAAGAVLVARREHKLPQLKDRTPEGFDAWWPRRKELEGKITAKIDAAHKRSWTRLWNGRDDYAGLLDDAIRAAEITEEELAEQLRRISEQDAEIDRRLAAHDAK
jgi:hypothetical protein